MQRLLPLFLPMSAILAVFNRKGDPVEQAAIGAMLAANRNRAVDGERAWCQGPFALAHQHFWVTPEEVGERQPLLSDNGRLLISADARLDNRKELLQRLAPEHRSNNASDSHLILAAYRRWGPRCVEHFLGDFAILIADLAERTLFLARDPLGVRDLSYYLSPEIVVAASQISQIVAHPGVPRSIDEQMIVNHFAGIWNDHEITYYAGVRHCPPGHFILIADNGVTRLRYWQLETERRVRYVDDREYATHFQAILNQAVKDRRRTHLPTAVALSGGLDSAAVTALAAQAPSPEGLPAAPPATVSYVFDRFRGCDESRYIDPIVAKYNLRSHQFNADALWTLNQAYRWPGGHDFVNQDVHALLQVMLAQVVREAGYRLLLTGHYGDVLFTRGDQWLTDLFQRRRIAAISRVWRRPPAGLSRRTIVRRGLRAITPTTIRAGYRRLLRRQAATAPPGVDGRLHDRVKAAVQAQRLKRQPGEDALRWYHREQLTSPSWTVTSSASLQTFDSQGIYRVDPYRDVRLVEFALALPVDQLGRPGVTKYILRQAMQDHLPDIVLDRRGKTVFTEQYVFGMARSQSLVAGLLANAHIVQHRFVDHSWLEAALADWDSYYDSWFLWLCVALELWLRDFWSGKTEVNGPLNSHQSGGRYLQEIR